MVLDHIYVKQLLSKLLHSDAWSENDLKSFIALLQKANIPKQLKTGYLENWNKDSQTSELTEPWLSIIRLLLYKLIIDGNENQRMISEFFSRFDELSQSEWFDSDEEIENYFTDGANFQSLIIWENYCYYVNYKCLR